MYICNKYCHTVFMKHLTQAVWFQSLLSISRTYCFQIPLCHLLAVWFGANYLTSQDLFFLLKNACKTFLIGLKTNKCRPSS